MGNKASIGTIFISFDQADVLAGVEATGKVYLEINQDEVSCTSIGTRLLGQELTEITSAGENGGSTTVREHRNFMETYCCLKNVPEEKICRGQYEFPFTFVIPENTPARMTATTGGGCCCKIAYSMEVWLERPGMLRWDIRNLMQIDVHHRPTVQSKLPLYVEPSVTTLRSCFCYPRGDVWFGLAAESSVLSAGDATYVKYAVRNSSTVLIRAVEVTFSETIQFSAKGGKESKRTALFSKRLTATEAGLAMQTAVLRASKKEQQQDCAGVQLVQQLSEMLAGDDFRIDFDVPATALYSHDGTIIHVQHTLECKLYTTIGTNNPSIVRNMLVHSHAPICAANPSSTPVYALPLDWAPIVYDTVHINADAVVPISLTEATPYTPEDIGIHT